MYLEKLYRQSVSPCKHTIKIPYSNIISFLLKILKLHHKSFNIKYMLVKEKFKIPKTFRYVYRYNNNNGNINNYHCNTINNLIINFKLLGGDLQSLKQ